MGSWEIYSDVFPGSTFVQELEKSTSVHGRTGVEILYGVISPTHSVPLNRLFSMY